MCALLYHAYKYLPPLVMIFFNKGRMRRKMEQCCHIISDDAHCSRDWIDELFSHYNPIPPKGISVRQSLIYRYFHGKCSDELYYLDSPDMWNTPFHIYRLSSFHSYSMNKKGSTRITFPPKLLICGTDSWLNGLIDSFSVAYQLFAGYSMS